MYLSQHGEVICDLLTFSRTYVNLQLQFCTQAAIAVEAGGNNQKTGIRLSIIRKEEPKTVLGAEERRSKEEANIGHGAELHQTNSGAGR